MGGTCSPFSAARERGTQGFGDGERPPDGAATKTRTRESGTEGRRLESSRNGLVKSGERLGPGGLRRRPFYKGESAGAARVCILVSFGWTQGLGAVGSRRRWMRDPGGGRRAGRAGR